jgi:hypothetical protein
VNKSYRSLGVGGAYTPCQRRRPTLHQRGIPIGYHARVIRRRGAHSAAQLHVCTSANPLTLILAPQGLSPGARRPSAPHRLARPSPSPQFGDSGHDPGALPPHPQLPYHGTSFIPLSPWNKSVKLLMGEMTCRQCQSMRSPPIHLSLLCSSPHSSHSYFISLTLLSSTSSTPSSTRHPRSLTRTHLRVPPSSFARTLPGSSPSCLPPNAKAGRAHAVDRGRPSSIADHGKQSATAHASHANASNAPCTRRRGLPLSPSPNRPNSHSLSHHCPKSRTFASTHTFPQLQLGQHGQPPNQDSLAFPTHPSQVVTSPHDSRSPRPHSRSHSPPPQCLSKVCPSTSRSSSSAISFTFLCDYELEPTSAAPAAGSSSQGPACCPSADRDQVSFARWPNRCRSRERESLIRTESNSRPHKAARTRHGTLHLHSSAPPPCHPSRLRWRYGLHRQLAKHHMFLPPKVLRTSTPPSKSRHRQ